MAQFIPTERQLWYQSAMVSMEEPVEVGFGGGRYGGKTFCNASIAFELSGRHPGTRGAVFRQDSVDLTRSTMQTFRDWMAVYQPGMRVVWHNSPPIYCDMDFGGGRPSRIYWMDTKRPSDTQSLNLHWAIIDEASETSEEFYLMLQAALGRCVLPDGTRPAMKLGWTSNPGPGWCKSYFPVGKGPAKTEIAFGGKRVGWKFFFPSWVKDNPHADPLFEARIRSQYPESWVRRWLEGDWDAFEGQVFPELDPEPGGAHVVRREMVDAIGIGELDWTHMLCVDYGFKNPLAALRVSIDPEGCVWVWGEYRAVERTPAEHAPHLAVLAEPIRRGRTDLMDPAAVDQSSGVPLWEQFNLLQGYGFRFSGWSKRRHGPDGSIMWTKQALKERRLKIDERCAGLLKEMLEAEWEPQSAGAAQRGNPKETMRKKNDHSIEAMFGGIEFYRRVPGVMNETEAETEERKALETLRLNWQADRRNVLVKRHEEGDRQAARARAANYL